MSLSISIQNKAFFPFCLSFSSFVCLLLFVFSFSLFCLLFVCLLFVRLLSLFCVLLLLLLLLLFLVVVVFV